MRKVREGWGAASGLRAEFGPQRLNRAVAGLVLRVAALVALCALGSQFLIR